MKLRSIWVTERADGKDWMFTTYGTRAEAVKLARVFNVVPNIEHKWKATRFVRACQPMERP
jgi:hypothetical protein